MRKESSISFAHCFRIVGLIALIVLLASSGSVAQNVAINENGDAPDSSAILDVSSSDQGLLIPRMTQTERNNIVNPAHSLLIYQIDNSAGFYYYDTNSTAWNSLVTSATVQDLNATLTAGNNANGDTIVNLGAMGIGTTSPNSALHISKSGTVVHTLESTSGDDAEILFKSSSNQWKLDYDANASALPNNSIGFQYNNGSYPFVINSSGKIGIAGVLNPQAGVHISNGNTIRLNDFLADGDTGIVMHNEVGDIVNVLLPYDSNQYFRGDGTFGPISSGATEISDADGDTRIMVEQTNDVDQISFFTHNKEFFRLDSGLMEPLNTGQSVFLGEGAGAADDHSTNQNVFIGYQAGRIASNGGENVSVGHNSLFSLTTGSFNTGVGAGSLFGASIATHNTALGYASLQNLTLGGNNTAVGSIAGNSLTLGDDNAFFGAFSGQKNTLGDYNTLVGYGALSNNQTGSNNVAIGYEAGKGSATHSNSGNVFIGYQAGFDEAGDDKLYIDNSSIPTPLIWGDFQNDLLQVNGTFSIFGTDTLVFPGVDGTFGQVLTTNGNGTLGWSDAGDDLGNHSLTQNLKINAFWISNDGDDEGISIDTVGQVGINNSSPTSALDVDGDVEIAASGAYYLGDPDTDGSWRIQQDGDDLSFERRELGSWVFKMKLNP